MANHRIDPLFDLIKSLTKTEKRHFRLFVNRSGNTDDVKFIKLFDAMESMKVYDDHAILDKVPSIKKVQFSNQKAHLYKQVLSSLRHYHSGQNIDIQLRESLDHAKILYNKGLYKQALKVLDKSKNLAKESKYYTIGLEIMEFEKLIESQYITRSIDTRAEELTAEVNEVTKIIASSNQLSNLSLNLYSLYLKNGYAKSEADIRLTEQYFNDNMPTIEVEALNFHEQVYFHQCHIWFNTIVQNFPSCYRHANSLVDLYKNNTEMARRQPVQYIKGYHSLLSALFQLQYYTRFCEVLSELEALQDDDQIVKDLNTEVLVFKFLFSSKVNKHFMEGSFNEGVKLIPELLEKLQEYSSKIDPERFLLFYYKIATLYFGNGDNHKAIQYLNQIVSFKEMNLREDIHCFARILNLIAHFDAGEDHQLEYQIKSTFQFIGKIDDQQAVQKEIFQFLRKSGKIKPNELKNEFKMLYERLSAYKEDIYERRPFLYLDILSWLKSKIENRPVQQVMQEKFKSLK
jgi:hypothetical protein